MKKTFALSAVALMMGATTLADPPRDTEGSLRVANVFDRFEQSAFWSALSDRDG